MSWIPVDEMGELFTVRTDVGGVAMIYSLGGGILVFSA